VLIKESHPYKNFEQLKILAKSIALDTKRRGCVKYAEVSVRGEAPGSVLTGFAPRFHFPEEFEVRLRIVPQVQAWLWLSRLSLLPLDMRYSKLQQVFCALKL
jgi:hypothetical protein